MDGPYPPACSSVLEFLPLARPNPDQGSLPFGPPPSEPVSGLILGIQTRGPSLCIALTSTVNWNTEGRTEGPAPALANGLDSSTYAPSE
jgi:hypothetical protein